MHIKTILQSILTEISTQSENLPEDQLNHFIDTLINSKHIFLSGCGRSGLMIGAFANRLMHLGLEVSLVNEITKPKANAGDLLIIGSSSGETKSLICYAEQAKKLGAKVALFTANNLSTLAQLADIMVVMPNTIIKSKQPMGSTFEQLSLLIYDSIILSLMNKLQQSPEVMKSRHANIE